MPNYVYFVLVIAVITVACIVSNRIITNYGNAKYELGKSVSNQICQSAKEKAQQDAMYDRDQDDINVKRLSYDDIVSVLSERGELRD